MARMKVVEEFILLFKKASITQPTTQERAIELLEPLLKNTQRNPVPKEVLDFLHESIKKLLKVLVNNVTKDKRTVKLYSTLHDLIARARKDVQSKKMNIINEIINEHPDGFTDENGKPSQDLAIKKIKAEFAKHGLYNSKMANARLSKDNNVKNNINKIFDDSVREMTYSFMRNIITEVEKQYKTPKVRWSMVGKIAQKYLDEFAGKNGDEASSRPLVEGLIKRELQKYKQHNSIKKDDRGASQPLNQTQPDDNKNQTNVDVGTIKIECFGGGLDGNLKRPPSFWDIEKEGGRGNCKKISN